MRSSKIINPLLLDMLNQNRPFNGRFSRYNLSRNNAPRQPIVISGGVFFSSGA